MKPVLLTSSPENAEFDWIFDTPMLVALAGAAVFGVFLAWAVLHEFRKDAQKLRRSENLRYLLLGYSLRVNGDYSRSYRRAELIPVFRNHLSPRRELYGPMHRMRSRSIDLTESWIVDLYNHNGSKAFGLLLLFVSGIDRTPHKVFCVTDGKDGLVDLRTGKPVPELQVFEEHGKKGPS